MKRCLFFVVLMLGIVPLVFGETSSKPSVTKTRQNSTAATKVTSPAIIRQNKVAGEFRKQGDRLMLYLNRSVKKIEFYEGKLKVGELPGARKVDVTTLMAKVKGKTVEIKYYDMEGKTFSQIMTTPTSRVTVTRPLLDKAKQKPTPPDSPGVLPFYPPHHGGIEVTTPHLNEMFTAGQENDIIWTVHGYLTTDCMQIILYHENTQAHVITQQYRGRFTPGQDGFKWTVPTNLAGVYTVQVKTCDNEAQDVSDNFIINSANPDLSVHDLSITPANPDTIDTIRFQAWVINMGHTRVDAGLAELTIRDPDGGEHKYSFNIPALSFGNRHLITKEYRLNKKGTYENILSARVGLATAIETHLTDNEKSIIYTVEGLPDLVSCMDINISAKVYYKTDVVGYVRNYGDKQSMPTTVNFRIEGKGTSSFNVPLLVPGQTFYVIREDNVWLSTGNSDFHLDVDPNNTILERLEDNNRNDGNIYRYAHDSNKPDGPIYFRCSGNDIKITDQPYSVFDMD